MKGKKRGWRTEWLTTWLDGWVVRHGGVLNSFNFAREALPFVGSFSLSTMMVVLIVWKTSGLLKKLRGKVAVQKFAKWLRENNEGQRGRNEPRHLVSNWVGFRDGTTKSLDQFDCVTWMKNCIELLHFAISLKFNELCNNSYSLYFNDLINWKSVLGRY